RFMRDTKKLNDLDAIVECLSALAAQMDAKEAAAITAPAAPAFLQAMRDTRDPSTLSALARSLSAVAARMEPRDAPTVTAQAAPVLLRAMKDAKDANNDYGLDLLVDGLSVLAPRMDARDAARVLLQAMQDTKDSNAFCRLALDLST